MSTCLFTQEVSRSLHTGVLTHPSNPAVNVLRSVSEQQRQEWSNAIGPNGENLSGKITGSNK